jgi:hypothetical protein
MTLLSNGPWRIESMYVEKYRDDLWLGVKNQPNSEIAGFPRNLLRGISYTFQKLAKQISKLQSGFVYHYAFVMLIGLTIFITINSCGLR